MKSILKSIFPNCFFLILFGILPAIFLQARGANDGAKELTIYSLKGPSGVGMIRLFEEPPIIPGFNVKVEALAQADLLAARFISGEAKIGILPPNMAAKIAASGEDIRSAAVIGAGMLSLLSSDPGVRSILDLNGKTVELVGQGATPDFVFQKILRSNGLTPNNDVALGYSLAYPEVVQALVAGRVSTALLPEPFTSMALAGRPDLRFVADIQEEWVKADGRLGRNSGNYPMTLLVVDGLLASTNRLAVDEIIRAVKNSIEWVKAHPAEAGILVEKHELGLKADIVATAVPKSNYVFIPAQEARPSLESLFKVFLEYAPASIGGALPEDRFYLK